VTKALLTHYFKASSNETKVARLAEKAPFGLLLVVVGDHYGRLQVGFCWIHFCPTVAKSVLQDDGMSKKPLGYDQPMQYIAPAAARYIMLRQNTRHKSYPSHRLSTI